MTTQELINKLTARFDDNRVFDLVLSPETSLRIYPKSINRADGDFLFLARSDQKKYLFAVSTDSRVSWPRGGARTRMMARLVVARIRRLPVRLASS